MAQRDTKAKQRAVHGTRTGASTQALELLRMRRREWPQIEGVVEHVGDFAGILQQSSTTAGNSLVMTMGCPLEYLKEAMDIILAAKNMSLYVRVYAVPRDAFWDAEAEMAFRAEE